MSLHSDVAAAAADFLLGDRRVRPSRNLVELPAPAAGPAGRAPAGSVQVEPKVMEVLVCLARRAGSVVTKDELVREVWEGRYVSDDVVWRSVRELRRALGDDARDSRFIETIPRRGYRLLAPVAALPRPETPAVAGGDAAPAEAQRPAGTAAPAPAELLGGSAPTRRPSLVVGDAASATRPISDGHAGGGQGQLVTGHATLPNLPADRTAEPPSEASAKPPAEPLAGPPATAGLPLPPDPAILPPPLGRRRWRWALAAGLLALLLALAAAWIASRRPSIPAPVRLAVLPLANLSGDPAQEFFADGLTEELISRLGSLRPGRLEVVGRTSVMALKGRGGGAPEIGRQLGAAYLLEGGVRREGGRARVTVRLVRAADGTAVWSDRQELELSQTLQAESAIAERVARQLAIELLPRRRPAVQSAAARAATDPRAHDAELRGRYHLARAGPGTLTQAAAELGAAVALDPAAASPRSGLADAYHLMAMMGLLPPDAAYPRAEEAALAALERDPDSVEARTVLGSIRFRWRWDFGGAEREFQRALAVNPSYAPAHHDYAWLLVALGRRDEGVAEIREAQRLEPLSLRATADLGWVLYRAGRDDEAIAAMRRLLDLEPGFGEARACLERALASRGRSTEALAVAREGLRRGGASPEQVAALAAGTDPAAARRRIAAWWLERMAARPGYESPYRAATLEVEIGDREAAFGALRRAVAGHDPAAVMLAVDPELAALRPDPRFDGLRRQLGLP